ncbi:hypothetical protein DM860_003462 [Cuscuta australis]|uniref:Fe2OG dioxygenase domain-containing protein n=1 Tax=Cuscuta australis TaxID=267555 RepID=A0A328DL03_9ASTE|nr:hypothetical protein DM860_003462 [Cuscuta australis]
MVNMSKPIVESFSDIKPSKNPNNHISINDVIPVVDLMEPEEAKDLIVKACEEVGFFKVVNHGVPIEAIDKLEAEALRFFGLPQHEKDQVAPANPYGYGCKKIGNNGDVGLVEYLLLAANPELMVSQRSSIAIPGDSQLFWNAVSENVGAVREMACKVLEMIAQGLKMEEKNGLSKLISDEKSDSFFRLNHYPPCPKLDEVAHHRVGDEDDERKLRIGFGEHTDPQLISAIRSNDTTGLQICLRDGTWVSVPPDPSSFFINVGDVLQAMSNGRFRSVRHRVVVGDSWKEARVSMIYFGGPPLNEKIAPLPCFMALGEERLYHDFTWCQYKNSAYMTTLGENRLFHFQH